MQIIIGQFLGEKDRPFEWTDKSTGEVKQGVEHNLHILDGLYTRVVTRQREFVNDHLPEPGEAIALSVWCKGIGRQVAYVTDRVLTEEEIAEALSPSRSGSSVRAVS